MKTLDQLIGSPYVLRVFMADEMHPDAQPGDRAAMFVTDDSDAGRQAWLRMLDLNRDYEILLRPRGLAR